MRVPTVKSLAEQTGVPMVNLRGMLGDAGVPVTSDSQVLTQRDTRRIADHVARLALSQALSCPQDRKRSIRAEY